MYQPRRFGYATYSTPDVARQVAYYTEIVGLTPVVQTSERAVLASRMGDEAVVFEHGPVAACTGIAFQIDPGVDLDGAGDALDLRGDYRSDVTPGVSRSFGFTDPAGIKIDLFQSPKVGARTSGPGAGPIRAGHISFGVPDCKSLSEFYVQKLGFRVSDWMGDFFVFLRCGPEHHAVNFHTHRAMERPEVHHFAFELKDWAHVQAACEVLGKHKRQIIWGPGRHGIGHGIFVYHRDPDDNIVEFFTEIDQMKDEALGYFEPRPWHEDSPQRPKSWEPASAALIWGAPPTDDFRRGSNRELPAPVMEMSAKERFMPE